MMSEIANCVGGVIFCAFADCAISLRTPGASSATDPTSVVSMCDDSGVTTVTALSESLNHGEALMIPHVAGRKSLSPL